MNTARAWELAHPHVGSEIFFYLMIEWKSNVQLFIAIIFSLNKPFKLNPEMLFM